MFCGGSKKELSAEEKHQQNEHRRIEGQLKRDKEQLAFKLLLLV
jgi:hypothetical protein